jgi:type I restriction enzyme S subunit
MTNVRALLEARFPGEGRPAILREHLARACEDFIQSGLADTKFEAELSCGADDKFWPSLSEALIFQRLQGKRFLPRAAIGVGPDFLLQADGSRAWVEVTCPAPSGLPADWLELQPNVATTMPHEQILLRWTSAIREKTLKLIGAPGTAGYLQSGIVLPEDIYVIAVNACRLRHGPFPALLGISQFPYAAEAVLPIGPYQLQIDKSSLEVVGRGHQHRVAIRKPNGAAVSTYAFLDPQNRQVSAVWAADFNGCASIGNTEPSAVIHNPFAACPLPIGFLPCDDEYVAKHLNDDELLFERIEASSSDG